jgi:predicted nucleotidyltransferase
MRRRRSIPPVGKEVVDALRDLYGTRLRAVILHGSQARGDATPESDIDLMVVLDNFGDAEAELTRMDPIANRLSLLHDVLISFIAVRERDYLERQSPLLMNVRREGLAV